MLRHWKASLLLGLLLSLPTSFVLGQGAILQGGPWTSGHVPMYVGQGSSQPVIQDGGPASGAATGGNVSELGITMRSPTGTYPAVGTSSGVLGTPLCLYDAPITNSTGYHFLCLGPNATTGAGVIDFGSAGSATALPFNFIINGTTYTFPFVVGGIVGPGTSIVNDFACWNNTSGTLLKDCGAVVTAGSNNTFTGTNTFTSTTNFTGTFQVNATTETFPASGNIVGTSDAQTLTNKSIAASEINSGTLSAAQSWALTGDVTSSAGASATTIAAGVVTNAKQAAMTQNAVKGAATSTAVADLSVPSCSSAGNALQWTTNTGFACGTFTNQTAGWGLTGTTTFSISTSQPPYGFDQPVNIGLTSSVAASALTITLTGANGSTPSATNPVSIPFRSTTLSATTGAPVWATITAANSITINSAATLGTSNSVPFRIWIFLEYNGGAPQLAVATCSNITTIYPCASWESNRVTSTTISGFATSGGTLYAPTGVSNDAVRIIGYCDYAAGLATAGSYASACSSIQLFGPGIKKPGDVIQTVLASTASAVTQANGTIVTNLTTTITPTSTPNLIQAWASGPLANTASGTAATVTVGLKRDGSTSFGSNGATQYTQNGLTSATGTMIGIDAPASVSSKTYAVYLTSAGAGATGSFPYTGTAIIILNEIMGALEPDNDNFPNESRMTG